MVIQPLNDRILVRRDEARDKTRGGILIPDTNKEPPVFGEILAAGTGAILQSGERRPIEVAVGERVLFSKYAGIEVEVDGQKLLLMAEGDAQAHVDGAEIQPLNDRILVRRDEAREVTEGGIIIPDTVKDKEPPLTGEVLAVGTGALLQNGNRRKLDIMAGDRVLFNKFAGIEVEVDGKKLMLMTENDVHAKVKG